MGKCYQEEDGAKEPIAKTEKGEKEISSNKKWSYLA
jgi:hypothetical protein